MTPSAGDQWRVVSVLSSLCVQGPSRSESDQGGDRCRGGKWWCGGPSHTRYRLFLHPVSFPLLCLLLLPLRSRADCALWRGGCFACLVQTSERLGSTGTSDATPTVPRPAVCVWPRPSAQTNESRPPPQPLRRAPVSPAQLFLRSLLRPQVPKNDGGYRIEASQRAFHQKQLFREQRDKEQRDRTAILGPEYAQHRTGTAVPSLQS